MTPELTVVIPTHNRRALLEDTLNTVRAQVGVAPAVVIVDDASTDDTWPWLESLDDPLLTAVRQDPGRGGSAARNRGFQEVRTPFVMFLDDDDLLRPNACATLVDAVRRHPDVVGSAGSFATFGATDLPLRHARVPFPLRASIWREEVFGWNLPPGTTVWRTEWARQAPWNEQLPRCEDLHFNLQSYGDRLALVPTTVLDYRIRPVDPDRGKQALQARLDEEVRVDFVAGLRGRDRAVGQAVLRARPMIYEAVAAYNNADYRTAVRGLTGAIRTAPALARSPILGPWLVGLLAKATGALVVPRAGQDAIRRRRRSGRVSRIEAERRL